LKKKKIRSTTAFIAILPAYRRKEVYNFLQFIYQKSQEEDSKELSKAEITELIKCRNAYLKNPDTGIKLEDAKRKSMSKYGL